MNRELRKAIHSGNGYDDYITAYQFLAEKSSFASSRLRSMQHQIADFYEDGGVVVDEGELCYHLSLDSTSIRVVYDERGEVTDYEVTGVKGRKDVVRRLLGLFFCLHLIPEYKRIIDDTESQIANMENDNILRGMSELRDLIRGDKYLTASAVSGLDVREGSDPFGIFDEEPE